MSWKTITRNTLTQIVSEIIIVTCFSCTSPSQVECWTLAKNFISALYSFKVVALLGALASPFISKENVISQTGAYFMDADCWTTLSVVIVGPF